MEIYVTEAHMGSVAGFLKGYIMIDGSKFRFKGVVFGRVGGHNVVIKFMPSSLRALREKGMDAEDLSLKVQQEIVQGNFEPTPNARHTADPTIGPANKQ
ncbi:MAG: hypothetical protein QXG05_02300 [Nitrososphaerota archaeon]